MTREQDIKNAVEVLRKGGVILYPTDTVWGIGCDATNAEAVKRVYEIKQRDDSKALICLVDSDARMQRYVRNVPDVAWQLIDSLQGPDGEPSGTVASFSVGVGLSLFSGFTFSLFGRMRLSNTASMNTTATQVSAKMVRNICGKMVNMPDAWVKPRPMLSDRDTTIILRLENPHLDIIPKPANIMEPNIMMEQPPSTA